MDTDNFVVSVITIDFVKNLPTLHISFDFSNPNKNRSLFSEQNEKVTGKLKTETPQKNWVNKLICLRKNASSFKCTGGNTKN